MNPLLHITLMAVTLRAAVKLTAGTVVRFTGNYSTTAPVLGVVLYDAEPGGLVAVGTKGQFQIKLAASQTFAVGDPIALNAAGLGITGSTGFAFVLESTPSTATVIL